MDTSRNVTKLRNVYMYKEIMSSCYDKFISTICVRYKSVSISSQMYDCDVYGVIS